MHLTQRQKNELDYHRKHAKKHASVVDRPVSWAVLDEPERRWWNAYWRMYSYLVNLGLSGKTVLVVGCGFGDDALRLAKLGANVFAFDLSPESLAIASDRARREGLKVNFSEMPAEALRYQDDFFDCVIARDILHHVDIPRAMREIRRVSKPGAQLVVNEIYSHSSTDRVRRARFVEAHLYPRLQRVIYGPDKVYITPDERKLNESDIRAILESLSKVERRDYFYCLVTRLLPESWSVASKIDRLLLQSLPMFGHILAGRVLLLGRISK